MALRDLLDITLIVMGFENTLRIEYKQNKPVDSIITEAVKALEIIHQVHFDKTIYELQKDNDLIRDTLNTLIVNLEESLKQVSLLICISIFDNIYPETLADVNYLGINKEQLKTALKYLQNEELYKTRSSFFSTLISANDNVEFCIIKRLFVILGVLERIGMADGVAIIAQYLYLGGL